MRILCNVRETLPRIVALRRWRNVRPQPDFRPNLHERSRDETWAENEVELVARDLITEGHESETRSNPLWPRAPALCLPGDASGAPGLALPWDFARACARTMNVRSR